MANTLALCILLLCWAVPDHFPPWTAFHTEAPAFVAAAIGVGANWRKGAFKVKLPVLAAWLVVLAVLALIQWLTGQLTYLGDALVVVAYSGTFVCAWLWGYQWTEIEKQRSEVLELVCILLVFAGLMTTFQILTQWLQVEYAMKDWVLEGIPNGRPRANVGQPNQAATLLLMGSVGAGVLMHRARVGATVMWSVLVALGLAITLTQSRTALLSAVLVAIFFHRFSGSLRNGAAYRAFVWLWIGLLLTSAWSFPHWTWDTNTGALGLNQLATTGTRPLIWMQMLTALLQHPWVGWGWLQVAAAQQAGALTLPGIEQTNYAHNIVLDLLLYVGIPIGGLTLSLAVWWFRNRSRSVKRSMTAAGGFLLLIPLATHSLLELPHTYAYFLVVAGLLLGAIDADARNPAALTVKVSNWVIPTFALMWIPFLLAMGYEYAVAEEDFRVNRFENRRIGVTPSEYQVPRLYLLTQLGELLQIMRLRAEPNMAVEELDMLLRVAKRYTWAPVQFRAALALGLNGRPVEATERLRVIKSLFSDDIYRETIDNFKSLRKEKYPALGVVAIP